MHRPTAKPISAGVPVIRTIPDLRRLVTGWRKAGRKVGLVPTLGSLHEGHLALVRRALEAGEAVIVSIFVNPIQFGPNEDFAAYPRSEADDVAKLEAIGAHLVWAPPVDVMYPPNFSTYLTVDRLVDGLDGPYRPGHFRGVATVVAKLLLQVLPDTAYFGEKDYQQLQVVKRLTRDLDIPVTIMGVPTVRDSDGLALSSRNLYLSADERGRAATLPSVLAATAKAAVARGTGFGDLLAGARAELAKAGFGPIDYLQICDAETLAPVDDLTRPARIFVAARLGRTRLIDNMPV
jgi:pantoate--beta-alanine ligase